MKEDIDFEAITAEMVEQYKVEAANMMIDAFNQGYLLGQEHYKSQFEKGVNDEN